MGDDKNQEQQQLAVLSDSQNHQSRLQVIRLTGQKNFTSWKKIMRRALINRNLESVVFGDEDESLGASQRKKKDSEAWELLVTSMDQVNIDKFAVFDTSREIWERLVSTYERDGNVSLNNDFIQLFTITLDSVSDMSEYISKIENLVDRLAEQGQSLSERAQQANLLRGLNDNYEVFKQVWDSTPVQTLKSLKDRLLLEEVKLKTKQKNESISSHSALLNREQGRKVHNERNYSSGKRTD